MNQGHGMTAQEAAEQEITERLVRNLARGTRLSLGDGRTLKIRLMWPDDTELLVDFFLRLSPETKRRRFNYAIDDVDADILHETARRLTDIDNRTNGGAVAALEKVDGVERIVGVSRLMRPEHTLDSPEAEAAITVRDDYQRAGLGTQLVQLLPALARRMKVRVIVANIAAENLPALRVFRKLNLPMDVETSAGETTMRIYVPAAPGSRREARPIVPSQAGA